MKNKIQDILVSAKDRIEKVAPLIVPFIPLFSALGFGFIFYLTFTYLRMDEFKPFRIEKLDPSKQLIPELRARVFWGLAVGTFVVTLLWNVVVSLYILVKNLKPLPRGVRGGIYVVIGILFLVLPFVVSVHNAGGEAGNFIIKSIQERSEGSIPVSTILEGLNTILCIYFVVSVAACCSLLYLPSERIEKCDSKEIDKYDKVRLTAEKIEHTKLSLYLAGALLVSSVFEVHILLSWPSSFVAEAIKPDLLLLAGSLSLAAGILFSFLLTLIYLPIAVIHKKWISDLVRKESKCSEFVGKAAWLQLHELETSELDILKGFLVIIAPTIAGFVTKII